FRRALETRRLQCGLHDAAERRAVRRDGEALHPVVRAAQRQLTRQGPLERRKPFDLLAIRVEVEEERPIFVGYPIGAVGHRASPSVSRPWSDGGRGWPSIVTRLSPVLAWGSTRPTNCSPSGPLRIMVLPGVAVPSLSWNTAICG